MKTLLHSIAVLVLLSPSAHALQLNPPINSTITVNACKYKKTNNSLDLALINRGYFVIRRGGEYGPLFYLRHGQFMLNANSEIVTTAKDKLMSGSNSAHESLWPIKIPTGRLRPSATREITYGLNLPAQTESGDTHNVSSMFYDKLGGAHVLEQIYTKINPFIWEVSVDIDDQLIAKGKLIFDQDGTIDLNRSMRSVSWLSAYGEQMIDFDFSKITQYAEPYGLDELHQDGYPVGSLVTIDITADGGVSLQYNNGQSRVLEERISVATFEHPELLTQVIDNLYSANSESGEANIYRENGNGVFLVGYLEEKFCLPSV